jgi:hypothetical protein
MPRYADIPYLFKSPGELGPHIAGMEETTHAVGEAGLRSWQEAVAAYASQIESLFDSPEAMRGQIQQYCSENGGIRLWSSD